MPHNQESARATVLTPEDESQRKPLHKSHQPNPAGRRRYCWPGSSSSRCSRGRGDIERSSSCLMRRSYWQSSPYVRTSAKPQF
jgi:hypothetical protein